MYNPKSSKAEEFIAHEEVLASLEYGEKNKSNVEEIDRILNKAREKKGITHREAMVLLDCDIALKSMEEKAEYLGANAIIGLKISYDNLGGTMGNTILRSEEHTSELQSR